MSNVIKLTNENFKQEVEEATVPVLVDFWAPWCGPCRMMAPVLDGLATEFDGQLKIAKLDIENPEHKELAMKYEIQSIPALMLFKNGEITHAYTGFREQRLFRQELKEALTTN
jgi:thioredoxin 1